jgi:hypothetical protein
MRSRTNSGVTRTCVSTEVTRFLRMSGLDPSFNCKTSEARGRYRETNGNRVDVNDPERANRTPLHSSTDQSPARVRSNWHPVGRKRARRSPSEADGRE